MSSRFLSALRSLLLGGLLLLPNLVSAQAPPKQWDRTFGGSGDDALASLVPTPDGGFILGGTSNSGISGDKTQPQAAGRIEPYNQDYWVVKTDSLGHKLWDRTFGGGSSERLAQVLPTSDGGYLLAGSSTSGVSGDRTEPMRIDSLDFDHPWDFWIVKLDAAGNKEWDRSFGGYYDDVLICALQTRDGGYLLAGHSTSNATGDKSEPNYGGSFRADADWWIVKIDAGGRKLWDRTFGTARWDQPAGLVEAADGTYLLGGYSQDYTFGTSRKNADWRVLNFDAQGRRLWEQTYGGSDDDYLTSLQLASGGGYLLGGYSRSAASGDKSQSGQGGFDYWVVKISPNGRKLWDRTFGSAGADYLTALTPTPGGGYLLAGYSDGTATGDKTAAGPGGQDWWLVGIDAVGRMQWNATYGATAAEQAPVVQLVPGGGVLLGGPSESGSSGDKTAPSRGGTDFWVLKLAPARLVAPFIPNIITPNGDQLNEQFVVLGLPAGSGLRVYSRWGREVYRSAAYRNDWGHGAAPGLYYYVLQLPDSRQSIKGWLQVLR